MKRLDSNKAIKIKERIMAWWSTLSDEEFERRLMASAEYQLKWMMESPLLKRWAALTEAYEEAGLASAAAQLRTASLLIGAADLALTAGVPLALWIGVFAALGAPYAQAEALVKQKNFIHGFAEGFVIGLLKWEWQQAASRFGRFAPDTNTSGDTEMGYISANAHNAGLRTGYVHGTLIPPAKKKQLLHQLRSWSPAASAGSWDRIHQIMYVTDLAMAGIRHNFFR
jgi:hypothetical protein